MAVVGASLRNANVAAIYLVHGTFVGSDALGLLAQVGRFLPGVGDVLRRLSKQLVDVVAQDIGNYTRQYADTFSAAINPPGARPIAVRLFAWSSQNNHIGRADAAVRLIAELDKQEFSADSRLLFWGHSHAGNVFALLTNLLFGDRTFRDGFFGRCRAYYRCPIRRKYDVAVWDQVADRLNHFPLPLANVALDIATFGTPIRYGWCLRDCDRLLNVIHHHPRPDLPHHRTRFPPTVDDLLTAADGDYVQQFGIAGTNIAPGLLALRAWWADVTLGRLLERGLPRGTPLSRWPAGRRVPDQGATCLVAYPHAGESLARHMAGHGVYTRLAWLLFHSELVAQHFYNCQVPDLILN
jgi:hypothetical protein